MDSQRIRKRFCSGISMRPSPTRNTATEAPASNPSSSRYCLGIVSCPFSPIRVLATYSTCDWVVGMVQPHLVGISYHIGDRFRFRCARWSGNRLPGRRDVNPSLFPGTSKPSPAVVVQSGLFNGLNLVSQVMVDKVIAIPRNKITGRAGEVGRAHV